MRSGKPNSPPPQDGQPADEVQKWKDTADRYMLDALNERKNLIALQEHMDKNYVHKDNVAAREVGEALREALERHEYRNGTCACGQFVLPYYSYEDLVKFLETHPKVDIRWRYWLNHFHAAALAAPAPKPAPPAERE